MTSLLKRTISQFATDDCTTLAASLAFYTLFAMPPLLFALVTIVSLGMSAAYEQEMAHQHARDFLQQQASQLIGNQAAAKEIGNIIENSRRQPGNWWKSMLSFVGVVAGATGLMASLQSSLNRVWKVKPAQEGGLAVRFLGKRLLSLAMILGFGFILLVSFVISTFLEIVTHYSARLLGLEGVLPTILNHTITMFMSWACFTAIFSFMPDARVAWRNAMLGGLLTVILFTLGRVALFYYLSNSNPAAQLGSAAGSLVVILLWIYYSSIILLFGAEFTVNLDEGRVTPEPGAVQVEEQVVG